MEQIIKLTTGEKLRKYRHEKHFTQKELADLCGMYESQIRKYETGKACPKIQTLQKIANALGVSIGELYSDSTLELNNIVSDKEQSKEMELVANYRKLNKFGQEEAIKRLAELVELKKYTEPDPDPERQRDSVQQADL